MAGPLLDFFCALIRPYDYISTPSLDHCLRYAANYSSGREPCTAKLSSPRLGVVPGSFFNTIHRTTLPLANGGRLNSFFKVGIVSLQIGLQIGSASTCCPGIQWSAQNPSPPASCTAPPCQLEMHGARPSLPKLGHSHRHMHMAMSIPVGYHQPRRQRCCVHRLQVLPAVAPATIVIKAWNVASQPHHSSVVLQLWPLQILIAWHDACNLAV